MDGHGADVILEPIEATWPFRPFRYRLVRRHLVIGFAAGSISGLSSNPRLSKPPIRAATRPLLPSSRR
jgi:hypothetical protein